MIPLTRLNGDHIAINPDRIERADVTPDVVLTMTDGSKYVIHESLDELIDRIRLFRASVLGLSYRLVFEGDDEEDGTTRLRIVRGAEPGLVAHPIMSADGTSPIVNLRAVEPDDRQTGELPLPPPPPADRTGTDSTAGPAEPQSPSAGSVP
jgi:uncharacterized protein YlzI (FlbEa/FlbD family)